MHSGRARLGWLDTGVRWVTQLGDALASGALAKVAFAGAAFAGVAFAGVAFAGVAFAVGCNAPLREDAPRPSATSAPVLDEAPAGAGAPSLRDHAVVALDVGGERLCTGALLADGVVLTARSCVSHTPEPLECPASGPQLEGDRDPSTLRVFVGSDLASARFIGVGAALLAPPTSTVCEADLALVLLESPAEGVDPLPIAPQGIAKGAFVRSVGFRVTPDDAGVKMQREHLSVREVHDRELVVGSSGGSSGGPNGGSGFCAVSPGAPVFDERSGAIVGIASRGQRCGEPTAAHVFTRVDVFQPLIEQALDAAEARRLADGGARGRRASPKAKPTISVGAPCAVGSDCPTNLCVTEGERRYCSRRCGPGDRCPAGYNCRAVDDASSVCLVRP